ncbi:MAG: MarR family transcriptional regulator [Pseudomonadota bacterium]
MSRHRPERQSPNPGSQRAVVTRTMAGLTRALDWFDNSLQNVLASRGFEPVHRTQSMIIMHVAMGMTAPADIARDMGLTRQNVHHMAKPLIERGVIESIRDPRDPRRSQFRLSETASELRHAALETLEALEWVLEMRIGQQRAAQLRDALDADWGRAVSSQQELDADLQRQREL